MLPTQTKSPMIIIQPNSPSKVLFIGYRNASVQLLVKGTLCLDVVTEYQIYRFLIGSGWPENVPGKLVVAKRYSREVPGVDQ